MNAESPVRLFALIVAFASSFLIATAFAAPPVKPAGAFMLGVDVVELKGNPSSVRGAVLHRTPDGALTVAVSRAWLKAVHPEFFTRHQTEEADRRGEHLAQLLPRIDAWIADRSDDPRLVTFLKSERDRLQRSANIDGKPAALDTQFVVLEFPASKVKKVAFAPADRKQIALVAWQEELADVETRSAADLQEALQAAGVDAAEQMVDLSGRLPSGPESERHWAARRAIVEYGLRKSLDFQGVGDVLVRTGEGAGRQDMGAIIAELFRSQVQGELGELLGELGGAAAPKKPAASRDAKATRAAEDAGSRGVRITRVEQNLEARRVTVEQRFLARMPDGTWQAVWSNRIDEDASKPRGDSEKRITNDPQVKSALGVVKSLGLGGDADAAVQTAVRFGAAVMETQKSADARFYRFRDAHLNRLDGPPLRLGDPATP